MDEIKREASAPENPIDKKFKTEPVDKCTGTYDNTMVMKTEVKEESFDLGPDWVEVKEDSIDLGPDWVEVKEEPYDVETKGVDVEIIISSDDETKNKVDLTKKSARNGVIKKETYACKSCDYTTNRERDIVKHHYVHVKKTSRKCTVCETLYKDRMNADMLLMHRETDGNFKCNLCGFGTYRIGLLREHMESHLQKSLKCSGCDYSASRKRKLKKHLLQTHIEDPRQHKCVTCHFRTACPNRLKKHLRVHSKEKMYKCRCKDCACVKPCKCQPCNFATLRKGKLEKHQLISHSGDRTKYSCDRCDYSAYTKKTLITHIRRHANIN